MNINHGNHSHEVSLLDDGTLDTCISVDGREARFSEADRHQDGRVKAVWLANAARELCEDGELDEEAV